MVCHIRCGDDWLDDEWGCQQRDADAFCKLKLCEANAHAFDFEVSKIPRPPPAKDGKKKGIPGFICNRSNKKGKNLGDWFGMKNVYFAENTFAANGGVSAVTNVRCRTSGKCFNDELKIYIINFNFSFGSDSSFQI